MPAFDRISRRTVAGFALRACALSLLAASPAMFGSGPFGPGAAALQLAFAVGALLAAARSARRGDRLARGSLNAWDEAAAFWAGLMLLHALEGMASSVMQTTPS